jgi:two-component system KDP operon response regulator KdpE
VVTVNGSPIRLTPTEYNLLEYLAVNEGNVLTHRALLEKVWGDEYINSPDYLKVYIQRLRNKIEKDPANPEVLITQRGLGYKLVKPA